MASASQELRLPDVDLPPPPSKPPSRRMYAIAFELELGELRKHYDPMSPQNSYAEIRAFLFNEGFKWQHRSTYYGDPDCVDAVSCVLAAQRLAFALPWFSKCVRDIQMLRITDNDDLNGLIQRAARGLPF